MTSKVGTPTSPIDENDGWRVVEQRLYEPSAESELTTVVLEAVAAVEGIDPTSITSPLLYEVVDLTAVENALFGESDTENRSVSGGHLAFEYRGLQITIRSDGLLYVAEPTTN